MPDRIAKTENPVTKTETITAVRVRRGDVIRIGGIPYRVVDMREYVTHEQAVASEHLLRVQNGRRTAAALATLDVGYEPAGIWAAPVEAGEIDGAVSHSAHLFQAHVPKVADVRAVVVGEQVFSARITAPPGVVDWRAEYQSLTYEPVACPEEIRGALARFLADFGLNFGAFDFAVTADGGWWFLECNPFRPAD